MTAGFMKSIPVKILAAIGLLSVLSATGYAQPPERASSAGTGVRIADTAFAMPQLLRQRTIRVWLPEAYAHNRKKYPVLYMQDGQNIFDDSTSFAGEWGADEAMDSAKRQWIIVAVDNGAAKRMTEYNPNDQERFGKGEGRAYLDFLATTLKPYIDQHYRTRKGRRHTAVAGSSMGGLISYYAGIWYPGVFGKAGVFSPSFWITPEVEAQTRQVLSAGNRAASLFFYAGGAESKEMVPDMKRISALFPQKRVRVVVNETGKHNEAAWRNQLPAFIQWLNE